MRLIEIVSEIPNGPVVNVMSKEHRDEIFEENAAALECLQCGKPYVWKKREPSKFCLSVTKERVKCAKSCHCRWDENETDDAKIYAKSLNAETELSILEDQCTKAISIRLSVTNAYEVVVVCERVLEKARYFWHRCNNRRLIRLYERLFIAIESLLYLKCERGNSVDYYFVKLALEAGERILRWFKNRPMKAVHRKIMGAYAYSLARFYEVSGSLAKCREDFDFGSKWYQFAATILDEQGEGEFAKSMRICAEEMKQIATRRSEESGSHAY